MTFFYLPRPSADGNAAPRVGITVGRALGGAVVRNRIKRRMREAVRAQFTALLGPRVVSADIVINPKKAAWAAEFERLNFEVGRGFEQVRKQLASRLSQGGRAMSFF